MDITLIYFDFPFWRAEVSRIALFMGGIEFNDRRIDSEEFQRVKSNGCLDDGTLIPFGQLPVMVVNGVSVAQTGGIARFCGKLADLYPKDDDFLAAQIDQFIDFQTDIYSLILFSGKDVLNEFPKIKSICSLVDEHPDVVEWMSRTYPKNYPRGSFK